METREWSPDQNRIFVTGLNGERRHIIIGAAAGSGKTTTLVELSLRIAQDERYKNARIVFLAFGKAIVEELDSRLSGNACAKTINRAGNAAVYSALKKTQLDDRKYKKLATKWVDENGKQFDPAERNAIAASLYKLADFARKTLVDTSSVPALREMCLHFDIELEYPSLLFQALPLILQRGQDMARRDKVIDFVDQIWLPIVWNLPMSKYDFVLVDECQDLSACQLALVKKMLSPTGRAIFVGDRFQSIMGFSGADNRSFDNIKAEMDAIELPLSVCYRCPSSHLRLAQMIVPEIQPRPNAPEGEIVDLKPDEDLSKIVQGGDLILCRLTAPLISQCIKLIKERVSAKVRGRSIGEDLIALLEKIGRIEGFDYANVVRHLQDYLEKQVDLLRQKEADESIVESLMDRVECLQVCASNFPATSIEELSKSIEGLFSDDRPTVWLSTVHRAKGLEANRVFVLKPEKLPLRWKNQQGWQFEQEKNLCYVAVTRAKGTLYFLGDLPDLCQAREEIKPETEALEAAQDATEEPLALETAELIPSLVDYGCRACGGILESLTEQDDGMCDSCQSWRFNHTPLPEQCHQEPATSSVAPAQTSETGTAIARLDALVHAHNAMYHQDKIREAVEELAKLWNEAKNPVEDHEEERQKEETEERVQEQARMALVDEHERIATEEEEAITREQDRDYIAFVQRVGKPDHCPLCGAWLQEEDEFIYCPTHGGPYTLLQEQSIKQQEEWNNAHPF